MATVSSLVSTKTPFSIKSDDHQYNPYVWFKSKPLRNSFCHHVIQLQLSTDSHDQGWVSDAKEGSWSWFEVAIFENEHSSTAKVLDGRKLSWRSHANPIGEKAFSRNFGTIFDRRSEILDDLEVR